MDLLQVKKTYSLRSFMFLKSLMRILNPWTNVQIWSQYMIHLIWYFFCICSRSTSSERFFFGFWVFWVWAWNNTHRWKKPPNLGTWNHLTAARDLRDALWPLWVPLWLLWDSLWPLWVALWPLWDTLWPLWDTYWPLWDAVMFPGFFHLWWHHCPNIDITLPSTMYTVQYKYLI